jgi:hypothetical protein
LHSGLIRAHGGHCLDAEVIIVGKGTAYQACQFVILVAPFTFRNNAERLCDGMSSYATQKERVKMKVISIIPKDYIMYSKLDWVFSSQEVNEKI